VCVSEKLRDVYDKLDWADKHIGDLRKRIGDYFHSSPPAVTGELAFDFDRNTVDWSGIRFKSVDVSIPLTIGDAADNLRGALDYLAGVLVREAGNDPVKARPHFPILETPPRDKSGAATPLRVKGGVSDDALKIIEAVQPYNIPEWLDHPLLVVNNLANINKHRSVPTGTKEISDVILTHPETPLARYAVTIGEVQDDYAELIFTLTGASGATETGSAAYIWVHHAENQPVPPIDSLTKAAEYIRERVVGPVERVCT
jgi:hypothetical protein